MGAVYRALDSASGREVALKTLLPQAQATPQRRERLRREALALARLRHPYLLPVYGLEETDDGTLVLVVPLVTGETVQDRLERGGPFSSREAATLVRKVAEGVGHVHAAGVLHRDIKPENVLLSVETGEPLLADFGIARLEGEGTSLTQSGQLLGTPSYMAPEQGQGQETSTATDVYGLGGLLFSCLTARAPREVSSLMGLLDEFQKKLTPPLASSVAGARSDATLDAICARCLAHDPVARFASAEALVTELRAYEAGGRAGAGPSRKALAILAGALVLLAALCARLMLGAGQHAESPGGGEAAPSVAAHSADQRSSWLQRAQKRSKRGDNEGALKAAETLLAHEPHNQEAWGWKVRSLALLDRLEEALAEAERMVELWPEAGEPYFQRGSVHEFRIARVGRHVAEPLALADYDRAIRLGLSRRQERNTRINRAGLHRDADRYAPAAEDYRWLAADKPQDTKARINLAFIASQQGRHDAALEQLAAVLAIDPNEPDALMNRAGMLEARGLHDDARDDLRRVLALGDTLTHSQRCQAHTLLSRVHFKRGELALAVESQREAVRFAKVCADAVDRSRDWVALANLLVQAEGRASGVGVLDEYLATHPRHLGTVRARYEILRKGGTLKDIVATVNLALPTHAGTPTVEMMKAEIAEASSRQQDALLHAERAIRAGASPTDVCRLALLSARVHLALHQPDAALADLDRFDEVALSGGVALPRAVRVEILWQRLVALSRLKRMDEMRGAAERFLQEAPPKDPRRATAKKLSKLE
jgi:tetratricopeptide (TPR) repeat protein